MNLGSYHSIDKDKNGAISTEVDQVLRTIGILQYYNCNAIGTIAWFNGKRIGLTSTMARVQVPRQPLCAKKMPKVRSIPNSPSPDPKNYWEHNWLIKFFFTNFF